MALAEAEPGDTEPSCADARHEGKHSNHQQPKHRSRCKSVVVVGADDGRAAWWRRLVVLCCLRVGRGQGSGVLSICLIGEVGTEGPLATIEASTTLSLSVPWTRPDASTTAPSSGRGPIAQGPTTWGNE
jgi:hypothetical protein